MVYVIQVLLTACELHPDPARKLSANLYDTYHYCVYSEKLLMMDRGTVRNMYFYSKNKFEKFVHLVGFIIRKYLTCRQSWTVFFPFITKKKNYLQHIYTSLDHRFNCMCPYYMTGANTAPWHQKGCMLLCAHHTIIQIVSHRRGRWLYTTMCPKKNATLEAATDDTVHSSHA